MNEFWNKFKWYVMGAGALLFVGLVVLVVFLVMAARGPEEGDIVTLGTPGTEDGSGSPIERVEGRDFEGSGTKTERFRAGGGLTIFRLTHDGPRNFIVKYGTGTADKLLVNEIGRFSGSRAVGLPVGDYVLEITTTSRWTASVDQSVPTEAPAAPKTLEGDGVDASDFFALKEGPATFRLTHEGSGIFLPQLVAAADGSVITLLANEVGEFSGQKTVEIHDPGIYLVDVMAGGPWTIEVVEQRGSGGDEE